MAKLSQGKYLFHIGEENDQYFNKGIAIYITPVVYWEENKVLADCYTDEELEELNPVLDEIGLAEVMQSTYEMTSNINETKLRTKLIDAGFIENSEFSEYIDSFKDRDLLEDTDDWMEDDTEIYERKSGGLESYEE